MLIFSNIKNHLKNQNLNVSFFQHTEEVVKKIKSSFYPNEITIDAINEHVSLIISHNFSSLFNLNES